MRMTRRRSLLRQSSPPPRSLFGYRALLSRSCPPLCFATRPLSGQPTSAGSAVGYGSVSVGRSHRPGGSKPNLRRRQSVQIARPVCYRDTVMPGFVAQVVEVPGVGASVRGWPVFQPRDRPILGLLRRSAVFAGAFANQVVSIKPSVGPGSADDR